MGVYTIPRTCELCSKTFFATNSRPNRAVRFCSTHCRWTAHRITRESIAKNKQPPVEKPCTKCKTIKPAAEFWKNAKAKDGLSHWCIFCEKERQRSYFQNNKERLSKNQRCHKYKLKHPEYDLLHDKQQGKCAICHNPPPKGKRLDIDHCHATGKVRGLLCNNCNAAIGRFKDNAVLLASAHNYLLSYT